MTSTRKSTATPTWYVPKSCVLLRLSVRVRVCMCVQVRACPCVQVRACVSCACMFPGASQVDMDEEFRENHMVLLERFYKLFDSIYRYINDFTTYLDDMAEGVFVQLTIEVCVCV